MKRLTFFRYLFALPVAALMLTSCNDKDDDPYAETYIYGFVMQQATYDQIGLLEGYKFYPDVRAQTTYSTSLIGNWYMEKGSSILAAYSLTATKYEIPLGGGYNEIGGVNGTYSITATNDEGYKARSSLVWNFSDGDKFATGWGYHSFSYDGLVVTADIDKVDGASYYAIFIAPEKEDPNQHGVSRIVRSMGRFEGMKVAVTNQDAYSLLSNELPSNQVTDDLKVAVVVVKETEHGAVMLISEWKTIRRNVNSFVESI